MILQILLVVIALALFTFYVLYMLETILNTKKGRILYYSSDLHLVGPALEKVVTKYIKDTKQYSVIELGAGLAHVATYLAKRLTWKEVIAVEIGPLIASFGRALAVLRRVKVKYLLTNVFTYDQPTPSFVYCYISEAMITELYKTNRLKGQLVVSLTFKIVDLEPTEVIELSSWQKALYVYDLR